ncbi:MAG: aminotransferase class I/II-fold pyridoxal phosphate-dependent enzyme [Clostridia bacterium]
MRRTVTPLIDAIKEYCEVAKFRGHTPGHRGGNTVSKDLLDINLFEWDITEIEGVGNLFVENGPIYQSEMITSEIYDSQRTLFFTQGSTSAIQTAFLAVRSLSKKILVPRNAHVSVINAIIISGLEPIWYSAKINSQGLYLPFDADKILLMLDKHSDIQLVFIQSPTYEGSVGELEKLSEKCKDRGVLLIVDEAHGAHLILSEKLPISACEVKSDIVIQSPHKTLPALTGSAYLHIYNKKLINKCLEARKIIHSTSPSFLSLASLDSLNSYLKENGKDLYQKLKIISDQICKAVLDRKNCELAYTSENNDFTKIPIFFKANRQKVSNILMEYGIIIEKWSGSVALILLTPEITKDEYNLIIQALDKIDELEKELTCKTEFFTEKLPKVNMSAREAYFSEAELIKIEEASGRICARTIMIIPPGIPLLIPGEEISLDLTNTIKKLSSEDILSGIVVKDTEVFISVVKKITLKECLL